MIKYFYLFLLLLAGLGFISMVYKIAVVFWPNDWLLVFCVGSVFASEYMAWITRWFKRYY